MLDSASRAELEMFRESVRRYLDRYVVSRRDEWRENGMVSRDAWLEAGRAGLLLAGIPEAMGGMGGDFRHEVVIMEELARIGFLDFNLHLHNAVVAPYLQFYGTPEQQRRWFPRLASGELIAAIAMSEPGAGSDLKAIRTKAVRVGDEFVISGQKTFISNGQIGNWIIVACKTDPTLGSRGISLIALETDRAEGFRRGRKLDKVGLKAQDTSELFFDDVRVPANNLIGELNGGFKQMMHQLPQERLTIAVQGVAVIQVAITETLAYVKDRKAFGSSIFDFQNTKFVLADAATEATVAQVFLDHCIDELLAERLSATKAAMAKLWVTERQNAIIDKCMQLFGGYGYMLEYPIARLWADSRIQTIYGGTSEIMREVIARSL